MSYDHEKIDKKWQGAWEEADVFKAEYPSEKPKYYALNMFPYPSGKGLHVGHLVSYTPTDIVSRYKRAKGFNVLQPIGYDAFGLPAEQYAVQTGIHPAITTNEAITNFRRQLKSFGFSYDWSREISTCEPSFYKWTQFIFLKLFEKGLAYQKEVPVNWCPALRTVLANEEVVDGKSERGGHPVVRLPMKQWMLKITAYSEQLLADLDQIDWPNRTKEGQRHWIGKSIGAEVIFSIDGHSDENLKVFTTRPDTLFGATFMVLAPEHPVIEKITPSEQKEAVEKYVQKSKTKSELDRKASTEKTGVFSGAYAINPANGEKLPIWIADYVLMDYGTGAIMAVPGHDERDFEFAQKFDLKITRVIESKEDLPYPGEGPHCHSDFLDGLDKEEAINQMILWLEERNLGEKQVNYKLRDWLFSRQRYWGEPFPIVQTKDGQLQAVPENELPVELPEVADYEPSEKGEPPLARAKEWVQYGDNGKRITDTMPGSAGSSWYFLRYTDPHNEDAAFDFEKQKYWMPVDLYVGGPEHTVGHLLYSRFWHKVLHDTGLVSHQEPFQKLVHQGMLLGNDGEKMSKSRGNTVNPDTVREKYGADAARTYITFLGPLEKDKPWSEQGIEGVRRFLERIWRLCLDDNEQDICEDIEAPKEIEASLHRTIKKVSDDIENLSLNTAIASMMILVNDIYKAKVRPRSVLKPLCQLLMPFAPHIAEELWKKIGGEGLVSLAPWPDYNEDLLVDSVVTLAVQVNGKMKGTIELAAEAGEEDAVTLAKEMTTVQKAIEGKNLIKTIYRAGKILNLIVK